MLVEERRTRTQSSGSCAEDGSVNVDDALAARVDDDRGTTRGVCHCPDRVLVCGRGGAEVACAGRSRDRDQRRVGDRGTLECELDARATKGAATAEALREDSLLTSPADGRNDPSGVGGGEDKG